MRDTHEAKYIPLNDLVSYTSHPFKPYTGKKFEALANSVKESGVLVPIIVRPKDDKYEILSGHNRVAAAKLAEIPALPAVVRDDLTDEEARLIVVVTNLMQRSFSDLSHSERAVALSEHYNAVKQQGKRFDLIDSIAVLLGDEGTSTTTRQKLTARDLVAQTYGIGASTITQYLRVSQLIEPLKERLDNGEFSLMAAVELSFLSVDTQVTVNEALDDTDKRLDHKSASELRAAELNGAVAPDEVLRIITGTQKALTAKRAVRFDADVLSRFFDTKESESDISETIIKALEAWFAREDN